MNKHLEACAPFMLVGMLMLAQYAHADVIDFGGIINAITGSGQDIVGSVNTLIGAVDTLSGPIDAMSQATLALPTSVFSLFRDYVQDSLKEFSSPIAQIALGFLTTNPDVSAIKPVWISVVGIISGLYLLIFFAVGLLFMASFLGAENKAHAKEWFKGIIIMMVLIAFSFDIYALLLSLTSAISSVFSSLIPPELFDISTVVGGGPFGIAMYAAAGMFAMFTLFVRQVFVLLGAILFPIGIFLYFNLPFRSWGSAIFSLIGGFLALQFIDVILLGAAAQAGKSIPLGGFTYLAAMSFMLLGIVNIAVMAIALLRAAFAVGSGAAKITLSVAGIGANWNAKRK